MSGIKQFLHAFAMLWTKIKDIWLSHYYAIISFICWILIYITWYLGLSYILFIRPTLPIIDGYALGITWFISNMISGMVHNEIILKVIRAKIH